MAYKLELSIRDVEENENQEFLESAYKFVDELKVMPDLKVETENQPKTDTRGIIEALTGIIIWGTKIGAFSGLYLLAKDLHNRYAKAEVELLFPNGSVLKLKNLTEREALDRITQHLNQHQNSIAQND